MTPGTPSSYGVRWNDEKPSTVYLGRAQTAQLDPDGQTSGVDLVAYYIDLKGDLWISTQAIVPYRRDKQGAAIEPVKQASGGWAVRSRASAIMVSAARTHGLRHPILRRSSPSGHRGTTAALL